MQHMWKKNVQKRLKSSGKEYVNSDGKIIRESSVQPKDCSKCRFKCSAKVSKEDRKNIHDSFWNLTSYERKKDFICSRISEADTKNILEPTENVIMEKRRQVTRSYTLISSEASIRVCKAFFHATLNITEVYSEHASASRARYICWPREHGEGITHITKHLP